MKTKRNIWNRKKIIEIYENAAAIVWCNPMEYLGISVCKVVKANQRKDNENYLIQPKTMYYITLRWICLIVR